jgi:hypothetical protein
MLVMSEAFLCGEAYSLVPLWRSGVILPVQAARVQL